MCTERKQDIALPNSGNNEHSMLDNSTSMLLLSKKDLYGTKTTGVMGKAKKVGEVESEGERKPWRGG